MNKVEHSRIKHLLDTSTAHFNKLHGTTTVCQIILSNGFQVAIGTSSCVDPKNFDEVKGRQYAKEDAISKAEAKLWELEGYMLSQTLRPC